MRGEVHATKRSRAQPPAPRALGFSAAELSLTCAAFCVEGGSMEPVWRRGAVINQECHRALILPDQVMHFLGFSILPSLSEVFSFLTRQEGARPLY